MMRTTGTTMIRLALVLSLLSSAAFAQQPGPQACNFGAIASTNQSPTANYSATVGNTAVTLIPAAPSGVARTGVFIELLTASASLALNPNGGTPSLTAAGNIVITTGSSAPNNVAYINFAAMGMVPTGAITAIADAGSRVVSAWACPQ